MTQVGRVARIGKTLAELTKALGELAVLQWRENKIGLGLAGAFILFCLIVVVW
jgi:hypothetical protein